MDLPKVAAKVPVKVELEKGKKYAWCPVACQISSLIAMAHIKAQNLDHWSLLRKRLKLHIYANVSIQRILDFAMGRINLCN